MRYQIGVMAFAPPANHRGGGGLDDPELSSPIALCETGAAEHGNNLAYGRVPQPSSQREGREVGRPVCPQVLVHGPCRGDRERPRAARLFVAGQLPGRHVLPLRKPRSLPEACLFEDAPMVADRVMMEFKARRERPHADAWILTDRFVDASADCVLQNPPALKTRIEEQAADDAQHGGARNEHRSYS